MKGALLPALLLLGSCAVVRIPEPTPELAGGSAETLTALRTGRALYINKCSGCHALISVDTLSDREWLEATAEMIRLKKVVLAAGERDTLERYLTTMNARE